MKEKIIIIYIYIELQIKKYQKNNQKAISISAILAILALLKALKSSRSAEIDKEVQREKNLKKSGKGNVDLIFLKRIQELLKIVIPSLKNAAVKDIVILTIFLILRTYLSIYIASANGLIVKAIIKLDFQLFVKRIIQLCLIAVPASFVNSYLEFLNKRLAIHFRTELTKDLCGLYLKGMTNYQLTNLDQRVVNPDQRLTSDIEKWANSLSVIYSNFTKPVLDIFLFSKKLSELVGYRGPLIVILWYLLSGTVIKFVSPPFGKLTAIAQRNEGEYRHCYTDLVHHCEEVAFYKGNQWEKERVGNSFKKLIKHQENLMTKRLYMGTFDSMLVKYGAVMVGYAVLGLPVFGPGSQEYLKSIGNDPSTITRDYVRNSSLLINLAKAIGRLVISYKEIQELAGYTTVVSEIRDVLLDLQNGQYQRKLVDSAKEFGFKDTQKPQMVNISTGNLHESQDCIIFDKVPIITPNGEKLSKQISLLIKHGENVIVTGPNGCGKSSLFRILGGLWPIFAGSLTSPQLQDLFYIPQKAYLPSGTLRDQIIYPDTKLNMLRKKISDEKLKEFLRHVNLEYIVNREPNQFDTEGDWYDKLSGGEKQRISMARMFYHKPKFAILDECTSAVSMDVEHQLYDYCRINNITLFTISHRVEQLKKFHDFILRFDGETNWKYEKINH
ncbi:hypothetical protein IMG5_182040 [Ichthyophthirius multifiliis]|uniref:ABC transporter domain-containing protein n=1 Tax=Ichthyophthirius multifiliis TaxID=5932 RepID=G0R2Z7_ICHMU|nr:hypothetical protein IMG5_182040 [Ichthyophthirius multifiliis]EGR28157.1 hypothetical protein IMG5_182040 [Ichthyophthirius multifiliis]|eukprot:XP_004027502.1 hypothetical protein IMG5_182040 [Ichthyophthirius multifiliis]